MKNDVDFSNDKDKGHMSDKQMRCESTGQSTNRTPEIVRPKSKYMWATSYLWQTKSVLRSEGE